VHPGPGLARNREVGAAASSSLWAKSGHDRNAQEFRSAKARSRYSAGSRPGSADRQVARSKSLSVRRPVQRRSGTRQSNRSLRESRLAGNDVEIGLSASLARPVAAPQLSLPDWRGPRRRCAPGVRWLLSPKVPLALMLSPYACAASSELHGIRSPVEASSHSKAGLVSAH
jgi:hypothetical protein